MKKAECRMQKKVGAFGGARISAFRSRLKAAFPDRRLQAAAAPHA